MKNQAGKILQDIELLNIKRDTAFFFSVIEALRKTEYSSIIIINIIPYLSMYIVESMKWVNKNISKEAKKIELYHENIINSSRNRIKIFDDKKDDIEQKIKFIEFIIRNQNDVFNFKHRGLLGFLQKILQCDMGLTLYENRLISSTFTSIFNLGYSETHLNISPKRFNKSIGESSRSLGIEIGQYVGSILRALEINSIDFSRLESANNRNFFYYDVKAKGFLSKIFPDIDNDSLSLYMLYILTELNFMKVLDDILGLYDQITMFKMKYITIYHIISSIKKLRDYSFKHKIIDRSFSQKLSNMIRQDDIQLITGQKRFRNAIVHYEIRNVSEDYLDRDLPLFGFVEYYFSGITYDELSVKVDNVLLELSKSLIDFMNWSPSEFRIQCYQE